MPFVSPAYMYIAKLSLIDHFTDTAAILNKLDLMSIMGFPGGINIDLLCTNSVIAPFSR